MIAARKGILPDRTRLKKRFPVIPCILMIVGAAYAAEDVKTQMETSEGLLAKASGNVVLPFGCLQC